MTTIPLPSSLPHRRVACVWLPHVAVALEEREDLRRVGRPFVVVEAGSGLPRVLDRSYAADLCGVLPGMTLGQATRLCPGLAAYPARPRAYRDVFADLVAALDPLGAAMEPGDLDLIWVELRGLAGSLAAEQAKVREIQEAARQATGIAARVALSDRRWSGQILTRYLVGGRQAAVLPRGMDALFLGGLPIGHLGLGPTARRPLAEGGVTRLAQFGALDGRQVAERLGAKAWRAWERLTASGPAPLRDWRNEPWLQAGQQLGSSIRNARSLAHHVQRLSADLALCLRDRYRLVGCLRLLLELDGGGQVQGDAMALGLPGAGPLAEVALALLAGLQPRTPVRALRLSAQGLCPLAETQPVPEPARSFSKVRGSVSTGVGAAASLVRPNAMLRIEPDQDLRPWLQPLPKVAEAGSAAAD